MFAYCGNNPIRYSDAVGFSYADAIGGTRSKLFCYTMVDASGGSGAVSIYISYVVLDTVIGGIVTTYDWLDELVNTIVDKLSKSLAKSGRAEYGNDFEEHHIVAKKAFNAKRAASILNKVLPGGVEDPLNKVMLKTSVHRRIHTSAYYMLVNYAVIEAYNCANGDPQKQRENVITTLGALRAFLEGLNILSTN